MATCLKKNTSITLILFVGVVRHLPFLEQRANGLPLLMVLEKKLWIKLKTTLSLFQAGVENVLVT